MPKMRPVRIIETSLPRPFLSANRSMANNTATRMSPMVNGKNIFIGFLRRETRGVASKVSCPYLLFAQKPNYEISNCKKEQNQRHETDDLAISFSASFWREKEQFCRQTKADDTRYKCPFHCSPSTGIPSPILLINCIFFI